MIAEIHKKISKSGSNLTDRLEDNLTGNFFGVLRYMPFNLVFKKLLVASVYPKEVARKIDEIDYELWNNNIKFWPYDENGEIDVLLEFEKAVIGIEVKYLSDLSSDDEIDNSNINGDPKYEFQESRQQLARESRIISKFGEDKTRILLFLAKDACCRDVYENTVGRNILAKGVAFGYISWQSILAELKKLQMHGFDNQYYSVIINDLINLLERKGFDGFRSMEIDPSISILKKFYYDFGEVPQLLFEFSMGDQEIFKEQYYEFSNISTDKINFNNCLTIRSDLYYEFK